MLEGYDQLPEAVKVYVPNFEYLLFDLSQYENEEIRGSIHNRIVYTLLRDMQTRRGIDGLDFMCDPLPI